jgi:hypothetical protein
MRSYAEGTSVSVEKTRAEIETLLGKHGAGQRAILCDDELGLAQIGFGIHGRRYRLDVPMPSLESVRPTTRTGPSVGYWRLDEAGRLAWARRALEQAQRERWRAVLLMLKAKLELVRIGVSTVEHEFLADMVLPDGKTMHIAVAESIQRALATGEAPMLALPAAS